MSTEICHFYPTKSQIKNTNKWGFNVRCRFVRMCALRKHWKLHHDGTQSVKICTNAMRCDSILMSDLAFATKHDWIKLKQIHRRKMIVYLHLLNKNSERIFWTAICSASIQFKSCIYTVITSSTLCSTIILISFACWMFSKSVCIRRRRSSSNHSDSSNGNTQLQTRIDSNTQ